MSQPNGQNGCPAAAFPWGCSQDSCDACGPVCVIHCDCGRQSGGGG